MRLPLLIEGNVPKMVACATIRLPAGNWKWIVENHNDSILQFLRGDEKGTNTEYGTVPNHSFDPFSFSKGCEQTAVGPATYTLHFQKKGTETNLNIYAEKCQ